MSTLECGHPPTPTGDLLFPGYSVDLLTNRRYCYPCSAERQKDYMLEHGKCTLYLTIPKNALLPQGEVTDWPGTLRFKVYHRTTGNHNIAGSQTTVWFTGPDHKRWIGKQYGSNSDICHTRRAKQQW